MKLVIDKPIRLIELFAGIGSQAKALKLLNANFEHYRICEFDKYAIKSYNAIHGTNFETSDITKITAEDLGIVDTDKYCYIMTYSFPCQDLSLAGKQKGMAKGENTRSGLLWEVERLLNECTELPQILLMENVTQVHGKKNIDHFNEWLAFLESKGYKNYWKDLNAKNFCIPQNRNRTFMVSVLGDYTYEFPQEFPLKKRLKDLLENNVDEKFYISDEKVEKIVENLPQINDTATALVGKQATEFKKLTDASNTLMARDYKGFGNQEMNCVIEPIRVGGLYDDEKGKHQAGAIWDKEAIAPTVDTMQGGNRQPLITEEPQIIQTPHGFNKGSIQKCCPTITSSKFQDNNFVTEPLAYDEQNGYIRKDGTVGTLTTDGSSPKHNNRVIEPIIQKVEIPQTVKVRKYPVDCNLLCECLRDYKTSSNFSNKEIAEKLNQPLTKVEHWFRQDDCFAIPDADIWFALKALLGIEINEFDESVTVFEEKENMFEKSNRCYLSDGIAPTLTRTSADEKIIENCYVSEKGVRYICDPQRGMATDINADVCQPLTAKGQANWTGSFVSPDIESLEKSSTIGGAEPTKINLKNRETLTSNDNLSHLRIRKLTPKECWRLMGFQDEDFEKAAQHNSNSQLYKQAGNSICVSVLYYIFKEMM